MKYTSSNKPLQMYMTQSTWYKGTSTMTVKGVLWHSTGANNTSLSRYCQPDDNSSQKSYWINKLGKNSNGNDWNHIYHTAGVNAWIGKLADGSVATLQVGPWNYKPWGCGSGSKGSCNNGWIQFEICEDSLTDRTYFDKVYKEAVELTAYLCKLYNIDPSGTAICGGVKVPTITCHQDSHSYGLGSDHADVNHWLPKFGKSMSTVRTDVASAMKNSNWTPTSSDSTSTSDDALISIDTTIESLDINPYIAYIDRSLTNIKWQQMKDLGVIGVFFEAGYLYNASHKQVTYRNPNLEAQVAQAQKQKYDYGLISTSRAKTLDEARDELYYIKLCLRKFYPELGFWVRPKFTQSVSTNNTILDLYEKTLEGLGMKDKIGFYCTKSELKKFTWKNYQDRWYLWIIDHVSEIANLDELETPAFFNIE